MSEDIYLTLDKYLYRIGDELVSTEIQPEQIASGALVSTFSQVMNALQAGKTTFDNTESGYILGLDNGVAKFYIGDSASYLNWNGTSLTISGTLTASSINIPDTTTANSFHVDSSGNTWWGATTLGSATAKVLNTGVATFTSVTITGGSISAGITSAAGSDTQVQYNDGGIFGGDAQFTWTKATYILTIGIQNGTASIKTPTATSTNNAGGYLSFTTGNGNGTGPGGNYTITTGTGGTNSSGGSYAVTTGIGVSTGLGGLIYFTTGKGGVTAGGGAFTVTCGNGGNTSGAGGAITLTAGSATNSGNGGAASLSAGNGAGTAKNGGAITIQSGSGTTTGNGGSVTIGSGNAGAGGTSGNVILTGANISTGGTAGSIVFNGGLSSGATGVSGSIKLNPGGIPSGGGTKGYVAIKEAASSFSALLDASLITSADRIFTFPDAAGTLALVGGGGSFTNTRVPFANSSGLLVDDADMTFVTDTLTVTKLSTTQVTDSGLTSGRVTFAGTGGLLQDDSDLTFSGNTLTVTGLVVGTTKISSYNGIATVSNGVPSELATIDSTGLTANVAAATLYSVPASGEGLYRINSYVVETTAGSISSTLPNVQIIYRDKDSDTDVTIDATPILGIAGIGQTGTLTANTVGTASSGVIVIYVKASTTIQYQTVNYASNLAGMTYALRMKLEAL